MKIKLLTLCLLCLFGISACTKEAPAEEDPLGCADDVICTTGEVADMSGYEGIDAENNQFIEITMAEAIQKIELNNSGIFYIGYPACPWCVEAVPIMDRAAKESKQHIYYVNKKAESSTEEDIKKMESLLSDFLNEDKETGLPKLYVPQVYVLEDGKIVSEHKNTVEGHDARERVMSETEQQQLLETYLEMFK